ncbi:hypothetical protein JHK82_025322 [Glycine max]|nr:hypothetical protein JHK82_025322 [Glycine max]
MVARQVSYLMQSHLPFLQLLLLSFEPLLMLSQCLFITTILVTYVRRIYLIKNRSIVNREHNDGNLRLLNCLHKCWCYFLSSLKTLIIDESVDSLAMKSAVEMASKTMTCVFPSEAEEYIVAQGRGT